MSNNTGIDVGYRFIRNVSRLGEDSDTYSVSGTNQNYLTSTFLLSITTNFQGGLGGRNSALGAGYLTGGYGGGPGTFAGYRAGLGSNTGRYGSGGFGTSGGYGSSGFGTGGYSGGLGSGQFSTGSGPSSFDQIGSRSQTQTGIYGSGSPFDGAPIASGSRGGDLTGGLGEFKKRERSEGDFGGMGAGGGSSPGGPPRGPGGAFEIGSTEDWWVLDDNMAHW